jgi:hypothetical protein
MEEKNKWEILGLKAAIFDQIEIIKKCQLETIPNAEKQMNTLIEELKKYAVTQLETPTKSAR